MIDIGWSEMLAIAIVMIVVVGPKDLPAVLRAIGKMVRKVRGMADEFRRGVDDFMRESELKELKDGVQQVKDFNLDRLKSETERQFNQTVGGSIDPSKSPGTASGTGGGEAAKPAGETSSTPAPKSEPANAPPPASSDNKDV